jgi:hypothetical protein
VNEVEGPEIPDMTMKNDEPFNDIVVGHNLTNEQKENLLQAVQSFKIVVGEKLGHTNILQYHIDIGDAKPIHTRPYIYSPA